MYSKIATAAALVALCAGFVYALNIGMDRSEVVDCMKWQAEARQYPGYYLKQWQADQCAAHSIDIDAPIK